MPDATSPTWTRLNKSVEPPKPGIEIYKIPFRSSEPPPTASNLCRQGVEFSNSTTLDLAKSIGARRCNHRLYHWSWEVQRFFPALDMVRFQEQRGVLRGTHCEQRLRGDGRDPSQAMMKMCVAVPTVSWYSQFQPWKSGSEPKLSRKR